MPMAVRRQSCTNVLPQVHFAAAKQTAIRFYPSGKETRLFKCRSHPNHAAEPRCKLNTKNQFYFEFLQKAKPTLFWSNSSFLLNQSLLQDALQMVFLPSCNKPICLATVYIRLVLKYLFLLFAIERAASSIAATLNCFPFSSKSTTLQVLTLEVACQTLTDPENHQFCSQKTANTSGLFYLQYLAQLALPEES